jgi:hypothetical protein
VSTEAAQPALFVQRPPLTVADIDEYIAEIYSNPTFDMFFPYEWVRVGLDQLLGQAHPYRGYARGELLAALVKARKAAMAETRAARAES